MLKNKLGIDNSAELAREEERISKKRAMELFERGMLDGYEAGKFKKLQAIHSYLCLEISMILQGKSARLILQRGIFVLHR